MSGAVTQRGSWLTRWIDATRIRFSPCNLDNWTVAGVLVYSAYKLYSMHHEPFVVSKLAWWQALLILKARLAGLLKPTASDIWKQCCGSGSESGSGSTGSTCFWASQIRIRIHLSEVWIRIRILLWILIWILLSSCKKVKKTLIPTNLWLFLTLYLWTIM